MDDEAKLKYQQGQLASRLKDTTDDILQSQERKIIRQVMVKLNAGETLDPQFAIQQWLELYSVQRFKRVLSQREAEGKSAGAAIVRGSETLGDITSDDRRGK